MPTASSLPERLLSEKSDAVALQQIKERGALPMIDRGDISSGNRPLQQYLGFTAGRWLWSVWSTRPTARLQNSKKKRNGQRDWCMSRVTAIISALLSASRFTSWAVNHTVITLSTKPSDKNARELEAGERGNYWHADASAWCCCARCKIHEGVSWC